MSRKSTIATLSLASALPFATMFVSLVLFKRLGMNNDGLTLCTSLLFTPWLLFPMINIRARKALIVTLEFLSASLLIGVAFVLSDGASTVALMPLLLLLSMCGVLHKAATRNMVNGRETFTQKGLPLLVAMMICQGFIVAFAGNMEVLTRTVHHSWSMAFYVLSGLSALLAFLHCATLRSCDGYEGGKAVHTLTKSDGTIILLYALLLAPEGLLTLTGQLFLIDARHNGGLGLSPAEYGLVQGSVGIVAWLVGSAIASMLIRNGNAEKWQWTAAFALAFPCLFYIYMSHTMTDSLLVIGLCLFYRLLAAGFAFCVCFHSLERHFASASSRFVVLALPMIVFGLASGAFQESMGYRTFFIAMLAFSPLTFVVMAIIKSITSAR